MAQHYKEKKFQTLASSIELRFVAILKNKGYKVKYSQYRDSVVKTGFSH